ncbi:MAG: hypothetical protein HY246_14970 [Proteobacteria bacterium]|nr:hypothetical protein [Pseudomonadota bacterium]
MNFTKSLLAAAAAAVIGLSAATPAKALTTWDFSTGSIFTINSASSFNFNSGGINLTATGGTFAGNLTFTPGTLLQAFTGLGVCSPGDGFIECPQVDSIGPDEYMRLELPTSNWLPVELVVDFVSELLVSGDDIIVAGAQDAAPASAGDLDILLEGKIMDIGTSLGGLRYGLDLSSGSIGYKYIFLFNDSDNNDGYSVRSFTGQLEQAVPEPNGLATFGLAATLFALAVRRHCARTA